MDLLDDDPHSDPGNTPEFTVSELSGAVKRSIEAEFGFVRVKGEVGRVTRPRSGHVYLDLKDDRAVIAGIVWKGVASRLQTLPEEGMEVVATGKLTTYPGQSKYQIIIDDIRPAGMGALMAMLEKRKAQLAAEGLFDPERKKPLPFLPEIIGVVTSPTGAVIRDILHRLRDRFPRKVLVWPVAVQGTGSAEQVARAIDGFNAMTAGGALPRPDLLIVARGGGSVEDLWGFNEENVARAAAASAIPLISAVGHETDTTLIDYVSDYRAPTPTGAAERAVPVRLELLAAVDDYQARLSRALSLRLDTGGQRLRDLSRALPRPETLLDMPRQRLDVQGDRLPAALIRLVDRQRLRLSEQAGSLRPSALRASLRSERTRLAERAVRLAPALARGVQTRHDALARSTQRLTPRAIERDIATGHERLAALSKRLEYAQASRLNALGAALDSAARMHETLGYRATLQRGYAVVRDAETVITSRAAAETAKALEIEFADGTFTPAPSATALQAKPRPKAKPKPNPPEQGSLF